MSVGAVMRVPAVTAALATCRLITCVSRMTTPTNVVPCRWNVPSLYGVGPCAPTNTLASPQAASTARIVRLMVDLLVLEPRAYSNRVAGRAAAAPDPSAWHRGIAHGGPPTRTR